MLLDVKNLNIEFKTKKGLIKAVRDVNFTLKRGETLGVVGESGCGKSITNLALMGLLPDNGKVSAQKLEFEGKDLLSLKERHWQKVRGKQISMIFQDPMTALNPCFSVGYQLEETLILHDQSLNIRQRKERSLELLRQVGIPDPVKRLLSYPHELSGGMSQRIMIAMAIACRPKLLIADEPTTALDVTIQDQILRLLKEIQSQNNMAMIFVTHDIGVVAKVSDKLQVMYAGEIIESSSVDGILNNQKHPYTHGLLKSLPGQKGLSFRSPLPSIKGMVPALNKRPSGCQFAPRCEFKQEKCDKNPILSLDKHAYRCHYPLKGDRA